MLTEYILGIYNSDITTSFDREIYKKYNINIVINLTQLLILTFYYFLGLQKVHISQKMFLTLNRIQDSLCLPS